MTTAISILAVFILLWLILKPFMLLIIEKQNDEYMKSMENWSLKDFQKWFDFRKFEIEENMKDKTKDLQDIYNKIFEQSVKHMKKHEPQMVAGTLMAIAIRLYKTNLSEDGFSQMLQTILDSEGDIKSYTDDKETLH